MREYSLHLSAAALLVEHSTVELSLPPELVPDPTRLAWLCDRLAPGTSQLDRERAVRLTGSIRLARYPGQVPGAWRARVGEAELASWGEIASAWCASCRRQTGLCSHQLALMLCLLNSHPETAPLLHAPLWELQLLPWVQPEPARHGEDEGPTRRGGWIRYHLNWPLDIASAQGHHLRWLDFRGLCSRQLVRLSKRGDRPLKPQKVPRSWDAVEDKVAGLRAADREAHQLLEQLDGLYEAWRVTTRKTLAQLSMRQIEETLRQLMGCLVGAQEVFFQGRAVTVHPDPILPELVASEDGATGLSLGWRPDFATLLEFGPGFLVIGDRIHPLEERFPQAARGLLLEELPAIPRDDLGRFARTFALHSPVPLRLQESPLPGIEEPAAIEPELLLSEEHDELLVDLRLRYRHGAHQLAIDPALTSPLLDAEGVLLRRDRPREAALHDELRAVLDQPLPARLRGEEAYDFLLEGPARLGAGWTVLGQDRLLRHRVVGRLQQKLGFRSGIDWFDLEVGFEGPQGAVSSEDVLAAWKQGRRFVELPDGSVARLPTRWLARHGWTVDELGTLRRANRRRLGPESAVLCRDLLDEVPRGQTPRGQTPRSGHPASWFRDLAAALGDLAAHAPADPPAGLRAALRPYQVTGLRWLRALGARGLGGLLADDMGLGKTLQTLAALLADRDQRPQAGPALVVAPASVVFTWAAEAARFTPGLRVHLHHGPQRPSRPPPEAQLVLTSYALLRRDIEQLKDIEWSRVVLDEAQNIKNPQSQVARAACALRADARIALSGTPIENDLSELWSLFRFLLPGLLGSKAAFLRRYQPPGEDDEEQAEALVALRRRIRPFMLRRLKSEVAAELPPRQEQVLYCALGRPQRALYDSILAASRQVLDDEGPNPMKVLEALTRLRQACCHPALLPGQLPGRQSAPGSAKLERLMALLDESVPAGHKTLVFSQWPSLLKLVAAQLEERDIGYLYLDGATRQRAELVARFQSPEGPPLFLISLKAGGTGLTLTAADHVIQLDPWWNPAAEQQAIDRAHRIGQTRPVIAFRLVARDTIEEKILALQERKRALSESLIDHGRQAGPTQPPMAELEALIREG